MRVVAIVVALGVTVLALVQARRAAAELKKDAKSAKRRQAVTHAARQKPGVVAVPKTPKIKRR